MATLAETLKKLNKGKREQDNYSLLKDKEVIRTRTSTGSPYLDYLSGGFMNGGYNCIVAKGGSGKSSISLLACKDVISKGKVAVYFDGEGTLDDSYFKRMGINKDNFIHIRHRNLERMLDEAEAFAQADEVGIIVFDSVPIFKSTVVQEKSASDYTIGIEAQRWGTRMTLIEGYAVSRDICLLGLQHYKKDPGVMMGDNRTLSRGEWQGTMMNTFIDLTKKKIIYDDDDKNIIGHTLDVRVKKSKGSAYDPTEVFNVNFYNEGGFNQIDEYARVFIETEIAKQGGAWIKFPNVNAEEISIQGVDNFIDHLKNNPEDFEFLKQQLV
jgi:RecA/RadA recombinase